ncbi:MAG: hypothetical protein JXR19_07185 [Bacteroidia bacterium]
MSFVTFGLAAILLIYLNFNNIKGAAIRIMEWVKESVNWNAVFKSFMDLILIVFITTFATIIGVSDFYLHDNGKIVWAKYYQDGPFFLYSVSLLSASLIHYIRNKGAEAMMIVIIIIILICTSFYSSIGEGEPSKTPLAKWGSIVSISLSSLILFYTQYRKYKRPPDFNEVDTENQNNLASKIKYGK